MMDSQEVKKMAKELGADLVGIASVQRFEAVIVIGGSNRRMSASVSHR